MQRLSLLILIPTISFLIPVFVYGQVDTAWVKRYNGPGYGYDGACAIAVDGSGNIYVTGQSEGSGTWVDYATIKYNSEGETLWVRRYNGPANDNDFAEAIAVDGSGNVYVTGTSTGLGTTGDYATIKYDSAGTEQWVARYNGPANHLDHAYAIAIDTSGYIYVTGMSYGLGSYSDYATIKYNSDGETLWVRRYNGSGNSDDQAEAIAVDGSGNVYVTGRITGSGTYSDYGTIKYNSDGETLWVRGYNGPGDGEDWAYALTIDTSGNVYVTGKSYDSISSYDYVTIKYNSVGEILWVVRYNGPGNIDDQAEAIALDDSNNVYVTGYSYGSSTEQDYATLKYNSTGETLWVRRYNGPGNSTDYAYALAVDGSGNVYVTGYSYGSVTSYDYATIKYNSLGSEQWVVRYNGPGNDEDHAYAIAVDDSVNVYVTGASVSVSTGADYTTIKYVQTGGIEERSTHDALYLMPEIYPNPAKSFFTIRLPSSLDRTELKIFDVSGKLIRVNKVTSAQEHKQEVRISLKGINPGIYFLQFGSSVKKLLVVR